MSNYQSFQTYPTEGLLEPTRETGVRINVYDSVTRINTLDGVMVDDTQRQAKGHSGELNPYAGTDSVLATAQHPNGLPVTEIVANTLVTINGVQAPASFWAKEGRLQKAPDGTYTEATGAPEDAPQAAPEDFDPLPDMDMAVIAACLDGMGEQNVDSLIATGIGAAIGKGDAGTLLAKFQQITGRDSEDAGERLTAMKGTFQRQADGALRQTHGLTEDDLDGFYSWARENHQGQLQEAINRQVHGQSLAGYRALADRWFASVPPSIDALKAAGVPVRPQGGQSEIFVKGSWMSPSPNFDRRLNASARRG